MWIWFLLGFWLGLFLLLWGVVFAWVRDFGLRCFGSRYGWQEVVDRGFASVCGDLGLSVSAGGGGGVSILCLCRLWVVSVCLLQDGAVWPVWVLEVATSSEGGEDLVKFDSSEKR